MAATPPQPLKRGLRYINKAYNDLLAYVERTKVIAAPGWEETPAGLMPPINEGGGGASNTLRVSIHSDGKLTQTAGTMVDTTVGSTFNGIPTILSVDGVAYVAEDVVVAKVEYEAVNDTAEGSQFMTTAITFEVYASDSIPADTTPSWSGSAWSTGVYYMTWAVTDADAAVTSSETGPVRMVYCSESDIRVVT